MEISSSPLPGRPTALKAITCPRAKRTHSARLSLPSQGLGIEPCDGSALHVVAINGDKESVHDEQIDKGQQGADKEVDKESPGKRPGGKQLPW